MQRRELIRSLGVASAGGEKLHFMKDPPLAVNGTVTLRDRPGFGIELDPAKIERQETLTSI